MKHTLDTKIEELALYSMYTVTPLVLEHCTTAEGIVVVYVLTTVVGWNQRVLLGGKYVRIKEDLQEWSGCC